MRLIDLVRRSSGGAAPARWSVLFASAIAGDALSVTVPVMFDLVSSVNYGPITYSAGAVLTLDTTKNTQLNCAGETWNSGSKDLRQPSYSATHTINYTGARLNALDPGVNTPLGGVATANRGRLGMAGSERRWLSQGLPATVVVKLGATALAGATSIILAAPVTWKAGWKIHLPSTDYYDEGDHSETVTIAADVSGSTTVTLTAGLTYRHHGQMQYVVAPAFEEGGHAGKNLSYTQRTIGAAESFGTSGGSAYLGQRVLNAAAAGAPTALDNRCTVFLMTFPMKVTCPLDADRTTHGYGQTDMVMGLSTIDMCDGVESINGGKAGQLGAYPFHDHMTSYTPYGSAGSGTFLGNVDRALRYRKRCSVINSSNRALSVHGHCGGLYEDIVAVNTDTSPFFLEDGSEIGNTLNRLWYSGVNLIGYGKTAIKAHDTYQSLYARDVGPAGFWYTNPNNTMTNCGGSRAHVGCWNSFSVVNFRFGAITGTSALKTSLETYYPAQNNGGENRKRARGAAFAETITLTATSATTWSRVGSRSGAMSALTTGAALTYHTGEAWGYRVPSGSATVGETIIIPLVRLGGGPVGQSRDVALEPGSTPILSWDNNEFHSSQYKNLITSGGVYNENGNSQFFGYWTDVPALVSLGGGSALGDYAYMSSYQVVDYVAPGDLPDLFTRANLWKCGPNDGHYVNVATRIRYNNFMTSCLRTEPGVRGVAGGLFDGWMEWASSLDDGHSAEVKGNLHISYHKAVSQINSIQCAAPQTGVTIVEGLKFLTSVGGPIGHWDMYLNSVEFGFGREYNNAVIGANPGNFGFKDLPPQVSAKDTTYGLTGFWAGTEYPFQTSPATGPQAGGLWMKGNAGAMTLPADGSYFNRAGWHVYARPTDANDGFFTYGTTGGVFADAPTGLTNKNGKIVADTYRYFGIQAYKAIPYGYTGSQAFVNEAVTFTRFNAAGATTIDTWAYGRGTNEWGFPNMRHASLFAGGTFHVSWPDTSRVSLPKFLEVEVKGLFTSLPMTVVSFDWDGSITVASPDVVLYKGGLEGITSATQATSLADLRASTTFKWWFDAAANKVYVALKNPGIYEGLGLATSDPNQERILILSIRLSTVP